MRLFEIEFKITKPPSNVAQNEFCFAVDSNAETIFPFCCAANLCVITAGSQLCPSDSTNSHKPASTLMNVPSATHALLPQSAPIMKAASPAQHVQQDLLVQASQGALISTNAQQINVTHEQHAQTLTEDFSALSAPTAMKAMASCLLAADLTKPYGAPTPRSSRSTAAAHTWATQPMFLHD